MTARAEMGHVYERKIAAVYDGKVRRGSVCTVFELFRHYTFGGFHVDKAGACVFDCPGAYGLQLLPDFFTQPWKALCGECEVFAEDGEGAQLLCDAWQGYENAQDTPYLPLSGVPAENPYPARQGKDCGALSEVQYGVYQEKLTGSESGRCLAM